MSESSFKHIAQRLEQLSEYSGRLLSWLVLILCIIVVYDVSMRFLFSEGSVALQELEWHIFAILFLLGAAYTYKHDGHVRVEVLQHKLGARGALWVQVLGDLFFLLPFCLIIIYSSWPYVFNAYEIKEFSPDPGGLTHRYLIKAVIPLGFTLLMLQGIANLFKNITALYGSKAGHHEWK